MDRETMVFEMHEWELDGFALYRWKRQATRVAREIEARCKEKAKKPETRAALVHTKKHGFKWVVAEGQNPVRRRDGNVQRDRAYGGRAFSGSPLQPHQS